MNENTIQVKRSPACVGAALLAAGAVAAALQMARYPADGRYLALQVLSVVAPAVGAAMLLAGGLKGGRWAWLALAAIMPTAFFAVSTAQPAIMTMRYILLALKGTLRPGIEAQPWALVSLLASLISIAAFLAAVRTRQWRPAYASCVGVLGALAIFFAVWQPPPPKPVASQRPISQIDTELIELLNQATGLKWTGRHEKLDTKNEGALGADEYLNMALASNEAPYRVLIFVTYNANAMSQIPHVPWVCMIQAGYELVKKQEEDLPIGARQISVNAMQFRGGENDKDRALMFQYFNVGGVYETDRQMARVLATSGSLGREGSYLSQSQVAIWLPPGDGQNPMDPKSDAYRLGIQILNVLVPLLEKRYYPDLRRPEGG